MGPARRPWYYSRQYAIMPKRACRIIALLALVTAACAPNLSTPRAAAPSPSQTPPSVQTDPAAEYCARHGGQLEWKQRATGDIIGMCVFPDGSKCEQWAYALHACKPGRSLL